jgi:hypothetical protein
MVTIDYPQRHQRGPKTSRLATMSIRTLYRRLLAAYGVEDRKIYVADSFDGLPKPDTVKYPVDKDDTHYTHYLYLAVSREEVENNFRKYGLLDDQVVFLEGWFKDTLCQAPIEKLSILRLDGDMYGSTIESLETYILDCQVADSVSSMITPCKAANLQ